MRCPGRTRVAPSSSAPLLRTRRRSSSCSKRPHVQAILALGEGEYETAFQHASAVSPAGVLASHAPHALWLILDLVEAAIRANRRAEAAAHVEALNRARVAEI